MALVQGVLLASAALVFIVSGAAAHASGQMAATYGCGTQGQIVNVARGGAGTAYGYDQAGNHIKATASGAAALNRKMTLSTEQSASDTVQDETETEPTTTYPPTFVPPLQNPSLAQSANPGPSMVNGVAVVAPFDQWWSR